MLPQYVITIGARTRLRGKAGHSGRFEDDDYRKIEAIVRIEQGFKGATLIRCKGFFEGQEEDTVQIIILEKDFRKIETCAHQLRHTFGQTSVLVSATGVGEFLKKPHVKK